MTIYYKDATYEITALNPFTTDHKFNDKWVIFKLIDGKDVQMIVGKGKSQTYEVKMSKFCDGYQYRMMDFIKYYEDMIINILLSVSNEELEKAKEVYRGHTNRDRYLRYYEPKILVHSTLPEYVPLIMKSRCLKSWCLLNQEKKIDNVKPIGELLEDPKEFSQYVMLGQGIGCEIVVSSKQKERIEMNVDAPYEPGGRFYFDAKKIANDGLFVRDGIHYKVKDQLPLDKYLICLITPNLLGLGKNTSPREFTHLADEWFYKNYT